MTISNVLKKWGCYIVHVSLWVRTSRSLTFSTFFMFISFLDLFSAMHTDRSRKRTLQTAIYQVRSPVMGLGSHCLSRYAKASLSWAEYWLDNLKPVKISFKETIIIVYGFIYFNWQNVLKWKI